MEGRQEVGQIIFIQLFFQVREYSFNINTLMLGTSMKINQWLRQINQSILSYHHLRLQIPPIRIIKNIMRSSPMRSMDLLSHQKYNNNYIHQFSTIFQGQDMEDPQQPSKEEIEELVKNWQRDTKKIKNPPPMPDFGIRKMIASDPVLKTIP